MAALITPVILSGGGGTRLWPLSRPACPKQFLALAGEETMLQATARRVGDPERYAQPMIIASRAHAEMIEAQLDAAGCRASALILEPTGRNTAPAIALAALAAEPDRLLLVMPSDHVIEKPDAFHAAVARGRALAENGWLVTFGITPDSPATGYGYLKLGPSVGEAHQVERFIEKPMLGAAEAMLAEGGHAWNGGIFLFRADAYLQGLADYAPDILDAARRSMAQAVRTGRRIEPEPAAFAASRSESIDYAVMERATRVAVIPVEMGWSDVGSWDALYDLAAHDESGNAARGEVRLEDSVNCLVRAEGIRVSALGVADLIIVATPDEILIMPRGRSQDVKRFS